MANILASRMSDFDSSFFTNSVVLEEQFGTTIVDSSAIINPFGVTIIVGNTSVVDSSGVNIFVVGDTYVILDPSGVNMHVIDDTYVVDSNGDRIFIADDTFGGVRALEI